MAKGRRDRLVVALEALKTLQEHGRCFAIKGMSVLGEANTKTLLDNGFLEMVLRGWYIPSSPEHTGTTVAWYACFWGFVAAYCRARFGEEWSLTPEESLMIWSGKNVIPKQVVVHVAKGSNTVQELLHGTSIFNFTTRIPRLIEHDDEYGLNIYPIAGALLRCSPNFYQQHADVVRSCLNALGVGERLQESLHEYGGEVYANRLAGALIAIGRDDVAAFVIQCQELVGRMVVPENPFSVGSGCILLPECSPVAARIRLMWRAMREEVLNVAAPLGNGQVQSVDAVLAEMDEGYVSDSYHSLSIEGYKVSEDLIRRVRDGKWNPGANASEKNERDAMAASGYYRAYQRVRVAVDRIMRGAMAGETVATELDEWHRELFMPWVDAGLLSNEDLRGWRRSQVYIAGSRYAPPAVARVSDAMDAYLDLVRNEDNAIVRAVLGHFFLVYIHPYADGNGRTARFVMNVSLVAEGYKWKIINVDQRTAYMAALEQASVKGEIGDFARLVLAVE